MNLPGRRTSVRPALRPGQPARPAPGAHARPTLYGVLRRIHMGVALIAVFTAGISLTFLGLTALRAYAAAFFQMEVRMLPGYYPHDLEFSPRENPRSKQRQVLTSDILAFLKTRLPADACCLLGITMEDLYPKASWNYVFGEASLDARVGIFSLARYDPAFWGDERGNLYREVIL